MTSHSANGHASALRPPFLNWAAMLLVAVVARPLAAADLDELDAFVAKAMKDFATPGVAVAVIKDDRVIVLRGYGVRRYGTDEPVDEHTLFQIASDTKSFTAALLGTYVDEDKIAWDDPVSRHLPEFVLDDPYTTRMTTLRDLLAHRSGLPPNMGDFLGKFGYDRAEVLRRMGYLKLACSLRERANYSNLGFFAAGMAASAVGHASWEDLIKRRLFEPLRMKDSGTSYRDREGKSNVAEAHFDAGEGKARVVAWDNGDLLGPAQSITSTAADLARWVRMLLNEGAIDGKRVLSPETVREMFKPAIVSDLTFGEAPPIDEHAGFTFTMGWANFQYQGYEVIEKSGAYAGMRSTVVLVPQKKLGVVVLANMNFTLAPEAIRAYILETHVAKAPGNVYAEIRRHHAKLLKHLTPPPLPAAKKHPPSLALGKYAGTYDSVVYGKVRIIHRDGRLWWEVSPSRFGGRVDHNGYDNFLLQFPDGLNSLPIEAHFVVDPSGIPKEFDADGTDLFKRISGSEVANPQQ